MERPERVRPEVDIPDKDTPEKEQPLNDKPDREKDISPAITKKPSSKKTRSEHHRSSVYSHLFSAAHSSVFPHRPKTDNHQSPPSDKHSIQSGKSTTKTNKNSHISRSVTPVPLCSKSSQFSDTFSSVWLLLLNLLWSTVCLKNE